MEKQHHSHFRVGCIPGVLNTRSTVFDKCFFFVGGGTQSSTVNHNDLQIKKSEPGPALLALMIIPGR